jgi:hypothetical protein
VFDYEQPPSEDVNDEDNVDYTGLKILAGVVPVFLLFIYFGKAQMGFASAVVLGMMLLAIKLNWEMKEHVWFWATIIIILVLHVPLILVVRVPNTKFPILGLSLPIGIADFLIISGALRLAAAFFSKDSPSDDQEQ